MIPTHLLCDPEKVAKAVLLPGDPARAAYIATFLDDSERIAEHREFLMFTGEYSGIPVSVCSTGIGAPSAVIALEELIMCKADTFIRVGTCGSLQKEIDIGDLIVPTAACRSEGTSERYVPLSFPAVADTDIVNALRKTAPDAHSGLVWTDDAFYITEEEYLHSLGILAVEMECSALFTVALLKNVNLGAILAVDGNLVLGTCKSRRKAIDVTEEVPERAKKGIEREIRAALEALTLLQ